MKLLLLFMLLTCSLLAMEEPKALTQFESFDDLPVELRAKVVMHLCDDIKPGYYITYYLDALSRFLPLLKTCKKYYLQDKKLTSELLNKVNDTFVNGRKCNYIFVLGLNIPTPACKQFLSEYKNTDDNCREEFGRLEFSNLNMRETRMWHDIKNQRIRFRESLQVTQNPNN